MSATPGRLGAAAGRAPAFVWLIVVWVALWGELSAANVVTGVLVAGGINLVFSHPAPGSAGPVRPVRFLQFLGWFAYKLLEANLVVAWEVVTPGSRINEGIVAVPIRGASDVVVTTVANAISLTPGTLTLEARRSPPTLYVHVLHLRSIERTRRDVLHLEYLVMRAFAPRQREDIAWLDGQRRRAREGERP